MTVELLVGQVVEPLLYGRSTGLSPFSVVVAAIFWSWIWGPIGLILSTPLTLCLLVLGRHIRRLEFLDVMLGDQPALTPVENFYQRALAGDPDEAIAQAEALLRERSLAAYYDEVTIKGLQLAANDVVRGSVTATQLARIESTTNDLVDGLDSYADEPPLPSAEDTNADVGPLAPWRNTPPAAPLTHMVFASQLPRGEAEERAEDGAQKADEEAPEPASAPAARRALEISQPMPRAANQRVLCIPGRGPLDPLATTIVLQLLCKHGFTARAVPQEAASRASIDQMDADDVALVCLVYLQIEGIPSHLRYMVRRIRARLPKVSIIVGLWAPEDLEKWSVDLQNAMGAECYVTSLQEMLAACHMCCAGTSAEPLAVASA
ncbi:MAG: UPF0118 membrane protein Mext_3812 [uncultured Paraburkholderia sp.]|nr:MAG: UPF0118 membrane protein Mext_3812 [uncultured Paraburkholderia sp.]CAH2912948.1 MAG: UPF0118 membrane protein Mext_3812 [uncultured Paraburkholderia sp.]CAH2913231.1 MAG: UPF0118 membrane protein Mext_3812 [uncultured Paraburkholderia sp.]